MTVAQRITDTWPRTEASLIADTVTGYAAAKTRAINDALALVYGAMPRLDPEPLVVEMQIADTALLLLLSLARDWYADPANSQKSKSVTMDGGVQGSATFHDPLAMLDALEVELKRRIAERRGEVVGIVTPVTTLRSRSFFTLAQVTR